jgi:hypothetical protein
MTSVFRNILMKAQQRGLEQRQAEQVAESKKQQETRKVFEDFMKKAVESGNQDQLIELSKGYRDVGGDPSPFLNAAGQRTPEQKLTDTFNKILAEKMGLAKPKTQSPFDSTEIAVNQVAGAQLSPTQTPARQALDSLFTPEFATRVATYKASKIDIGEHTPNQRLEWFKSLSKMQQANPELSMDELFNANLTKFGWAPEEATHLKNLPAERREAISEAAFAKYFNDPEIRDLFKKSFPDADADKALAGFVLNAMRRQQTPIPKRLQPFLDQFDNLHDDIVELQASDEALKAGKVTYSQAIAKEQAAQQTFTGELGRESEKTRTLREINKPYIDEATLTKIGVGKDFLSLSSRTDKIIKDYVVQPDGKLNIDRLPVGPLEAWRKRADKYGIDPDESRIRLRTAILKQIELMYQIRGKQLSDKEVALGQELQNSMSEMPLQFITKYDEFQKNLIAGVVNRIELEKAAGRDTSGFEDLKKELEARATIADQLKEASRSAMKPPKVVVDMLKDLEPGKIVTKDNITGWALDENGNPIQVRIQK